MNNAGAKKQLRPVAAFDGYAGFCRHTFLFITKDFHLFSLNMVVTSSANFHRRVCLRTFAHGESDEVIGIAIEDCIAD